MRIQASESAIRPGPAAENPAQESASLGPGSDPGAPFSSVLRGLGREIDRGEAAMRSAIRSLDGSTDPGGSRLIALQLGVYRYSEAIDIAARLADRASGTVKTVLQGGGQ
jgi:hypothetical protein